MAFVCILFFSSLLLVAETDQDLFQRMAQLEKEMESMKATNLQLTKTIENLQNIIGSIEGGHKSDVFINEERTSTVERRLLMNGSPSNSTSMTPPIAFAVCLTHTIDSLGSHQLIEYDNVITNVGNAFDVRHGHFVAPVKGIYLISVAAYGWSDETYTLGLELVLNGERKATLFADGRNHEEDITTISWPFVLEARDMMWVRNHDGYEGKHMIGSPVWNMNSFSGVLIQTL